MKSSTKRIMMSVLTLVMTVVALGTTTFAWFSLSNVANVSNISGSVQGGEGLEVRLLGDSYTGSFRTNLDANDWKGFMDSITNNNPESFSFGAVTTSEGDKFYNLVQEDTGNVKLSELTDGKNKSYLEFDLEFRSLSEGTVNLTKLDFEGSSPIDWINEGNDKYYQENSTTMTGYNVKTSAANAARIAFYKKNETTPLSVYQENGATYKTSETDPNVMEGNHASGAKPVQFGQWSFLTDSKKMKIFGEDNIEITTDTLSSIDLLEAHEINTIETNDLAITLTTDGDKYFTSTLKVRIWIEGWDADAYDTIYKGLLNVNLGFTKE